jgi:hypothetical protein
VQDKPQIILPGGFEAQSGLYLPTSFQIPSEEDALPAELAPRVDLIVAGRPASILDQVFAYATEAELGLDVTAAENVLAIVGLIPFWPSMQLLARFQRDLWPVRVDRRGQLALLEFWFGGSEFAKRAENWLSQSEQRVLFSEQQVFALQRLVTLHSLDGPVDQTLSEEEHIGLLLALIAIPGSVLSIHAELERDLSVKLEDERWLRFFIGNGGFVGAGALRNELGRAHRLYSEIADSDEAKQHRDYCALYEWLVEEFGLTFAQLQGFAFALHTGAKISAMEEIPSLVETTFFAGSKVADQAELGLSALSAPREWYAERFAATQNDPRRAAFEVTPFLQKPAIRQPDGKVMPIAPRALEAWMGATGNYYRLFDIARRKGDETRKRFTRFNGLLVERYVQETVETAFPQDESRKTAIWTPGRVYRDVPYQSPAGERLTPDVVIDLTPDLIVIEVTSSRLTERSIVDADPDTVTKDIEKVLVEKIEQLGSAIDDLLSGAADLPDLRIAEIDRIWPIVISSEGLLQTPNLWAYIRPSVEQSLSQPSVKPLTLLDLEDLEELAGLVISGKALTQVLAEKTRETWAERELAAWIRSPEGQRFPYDSTLAVKQFEEAAAVIVRVLLGDEAVAQYEAEHRGSAGQPA